MTINNDRLPIDRILQSGETGDKIREERFSDDELAEIKNRVGKRIKEAFGHISNAEIARRSLTTDAVIKSYVDGDRLPIAEILIRMTNVTSVNLHWLLTGKGPKRVETRTEFSESEEKQISRLAQSANRTFNEQVLILAAAAADLIERSN